MIQAINNIAEHQSPTVAFVGVSQMIELLQHHGVEQFMVGLVNYLEQDFFALAGV